MKQKYTRSYGGVIVSSHNYQEVLKAEGKDKVDFHNKHLKAYIKGRRTFKHGKDKFGEPIYHIVDQKYEIVEK